MMKTKATVVEVYGNRAKVESERLSACEGCHKATEGEGCSVCSLMGANRTISTEAYNPLGAKVGDIVMIESATGRILGYAALVFLLPLLMAATCYGISAIFLDSDAWQIGCAGIGFAVSFIGIFFYSRSLQKKRCDAEITEIIKAKDNG